MPKGKRPAMMLFTGDWLTDQQLGMCGPATRGIWIDLLCLMQKNGETGRLTGTVPRLARVCRCTINEMVVALTELAETGAADVTPLQIVTDSDGEVTVVSRRMQRDFRARKGSAGRQKRYRDGPGDGEVTPESRPCDGSLSSSSSVSSSNAKKKKTVIDLYDDPSFKAFWQCAYRKTSKGAAAKAFAKACLRADVAIILNAWKKQNDQWKRDAQEKRFVPHPATWLNDDRWEDEIIVPTNGKPEPQATLEGRTVEMIGGPGAGATGKVTKQEGQEITFFDETGARVTCHADEVKVVK
jgi:hypothetical protein